jgi:hypothetical protein
MGREEKASRENEKLPRSQQASLDPQRAQIVPLVAPANSTAIDRAEGHVIQPLRTQARMRTR